MANLHQSITLARKCFTDILHQTGCRCNSCKLNDGHPDYMETLADHKYFPLGEYDDENKHFTAEMFSTTEVKLFDISKTKFVSYSNEEIESVENLRRLFINSDPQNIQVTSRIHGVDFLYRALPISWGDFMYLNPPTPSKSGDLAVAFIEHADPQRRTFEDLYENDRYTQILKRNLKFSFLQRHAEMCQSITGFYQGPAQFGNRRSWDQIWKLIRSDRSRIADFVRRLCFQSNTDHVDFMRFLKNEISSYYENLRLDQPEIWESEQSLRIDVSIILNVKIQDF